MKEENYRAAAALGKHAQPPSQPSFPLASFLFAQSAYDRSFQTAHKRRKLGECLCLSVSDLHPSRGAVCQRAPPLSAAGKAAPQCSGLASLLPTEQGSLARLSPSSVEEHIWSNPRLMVGLSAAFVQFDAQLRKLPSSLPTTIEPATTSG